MQLFGCSSQPVQFASRLRHQTRPAQPQFGSINSRIALGVGAGLLSLTAAACGSLDSGVPDSVNCCNEQANSLAKGFAKIGLDNTKLRCDVDGSGNSLTGDFDNGTMNIEHSIGRHRGRAFQRSEKNSRTMPKNG